MFFMIWMMFLLGGSVCLMLPLMMPNVFTWVVFMGIEIMGLMLIWIGCMLYAVRSFATGGFLLNEVAKPNQILSIHERRGGQGRLRRGMVDVLEHIRIGREMIFKDTGGGTRIAGHRIVKTMETVNHNVPDWAAQYLYKIKKKYMIDSPEKLKELYVKLHGLQRPIPGVMGLEDQLKLIPELNVIMQDAELKKELLGMDFRDVQQMSELLYDGQVIHYEDYERFQESAAPYDLESYSKRRDVQRIMEMVHFRDVNAPDWIKYAIIGFIACVAIFFLMNAMK